MLLAAGRLAVLGALVAILATAPSASAAQRVITSPGPLTSIYLNDNLACSLDRNGQTQIYGDGGSTDPGSCGTYVASNGALYGPHGNTGQPAAATDFAPVSQSISGTGTAADPFRVATVVTGGGLTVAQTDSYATGNDFYTTDVQVSSNDKTAHAVTLYHAADCLLRGDDKGYGATAGASVYCSRQPNVLASGLLGFEPIVGGSHYFESGSSSVWDRIVPAGTNFSDTCDCTGLGDNGAGISWSFSVDGRGNPVTRSFRTRASADTTPPETTITSGPDGTVKVNNGTFSFSSNEEGATFKCSLDGADPPTTPCTSPFATGTLGEGPHTFRVTATDHDGNTDPTPAVRTFSVDTSAGPPPPVAGKSFDAEPVSGRVFFKCRGDRRRHRLADALNLPVGCLIDARKGKLRIVAAATGGTAAGAAATPTKSAVFYQGQFKVKEKASAHPTMQLTLTGKLAGCRHGRASGNVSAARRRGRRLWGKGKGRFRTKGRRSSATVRGTTWLVYDRCDGSTLTKVRSGRVSVRDFVRHKTIRLKSGQSYLAHRRRR